LWQCYVVENYHHHPLQRFRFFNGPDRDINCLSVLFSLQFQPLYRDRTFLAEHLLKGASQLKAQAFPGHGKNIPVGLACRRFQVLPGPPADVQDVAATVDQHGWRRKLLQEKLIRHGLEIGHRFDLLQLLLDIRQYHG